MNKYRVFQWLLVVAFIVTATACSQNASEEAEAVVPQTSTAVTSDAETEGKANARDFGSFEVTAIIANHVWGSQWNGAGCDLVPHASVCLGNLIEAIEIEVIELDPRCPFCPPPVCLSCPPPIVATLDPEIINPLLERYETIVTQYSINEEVMGLQFYQEGAFLSTEVFLIEENLFLNEEVVNTLGLSGNMVQAGEYPVLFDEERGTFDVNLPVIEGERPF
ncbi:MAG: hypothetical protein ACFB0B_05195 [Thermonemataceae bacterium]